MMDWNDIQQTRFDGLRKRELSGTLTAVEQTELDAMVTWLEQDEARYLAPATARFESEHNALRTQLQAVQDDNEALAMLFHQQEQLVTDARRWLVDFQQRHERIQTAYTRITSNVLVTA